MILEIFGTIVVIIIVSLIIYARWNYGTLETLGIPVVKPSFILGSTPYLHKEVCHLQDIARFEKYGPIYGVYEGRTPQIHVCDPEIVKLIFIKDFEHFHDRRDIDLGDPVLNEMLDFVPGEKWQIIRKTLTPTMSSARIKKMVEMSKEASRNFVTKLTDEINLRNNDTLKVDMRDRIAGLVIDYLARCSFGINVGNTEDPNNYFIKTFKEISGTDKDFGFLYNLSLTFPFLVKFSPTLNNDASSKFANTFRSVMLERRRIGSQKINDLADKLNDMMDLLDTPEYKKLKITENTILAQAVGGFFLAAYDSIITALVMLLYYLAENPEKQRKVHEEIDKNFPDSSSLDRATIDEFSQLEFLSCCIYETLRLVPPFIRPERVCTKDWKYGDLEIKKNTIIMLPAWAYNTNPNIWTESKSFVPERFLGENKKGNLLNLATFGFGPRNCPGMRFSLETMKAAMAIFLKKFEVALVPESKIQFKPGVLFLLMFNPVHLKIQQRG